MTALPAPLQQIDRTYVLYRGRKLSYFSGCDYFRLAGHPAVERALFATAKAVGLNVAASRLTTGNHALYVQLEQRLAKFFRAGTATLFSSGYVANLGTAQALAGEFSHVLIDDGAHASLRDAAAMLECPVIRFRHRDPDDLIRALRRIGASTRPVVLTDGIFPSDGAIAPLGAYMNSLPAKGRVWVDDAHAAGVLGRSGQGTAEHLGLPTDRIIRTVTLSKAFGVYGGVALGSLALRQQIVTKSRAFVGNTPMPLPLAGAALRAVEILADSKDRRTRLAEHVSSVKDRLQATGLTLEDTPSPIIALTPKGQADAARCRRLLLARHIYSPLMHYPGGPDGGYFRIALSSEHSQGQLDQLVRAVGDCVQAGWLH